MNELYTIDAKCHVCGKAFKARYNVGKRAKTCTGKTHRCKRGTKNGRKLICVQGCCRSKYRKGAARRAISASIDPRKLLDARQFTQFIAKTRKLEDPIGITLRFIAETGCRLGEAFLVRPEHFVWQGGPRSTIQMPTLKQDGHPEWPVDLENEAPIIQEIRKWVKKSEAGEPVFSAARRSVQRAMKRILLQVKPDHQGTIHILRHTRASRLMRAGKDLNYVRSQLRWTSIEMAGIYTHIEEKDRMKILEGARG